MRGALGKTTEQHKLDGTRPRRKANTGAKTVYADITPDVIVPPYGLTGLALEEWNRLAPLLLEREMFGPLDRNHLQLYCETWEINRLAFLSIRQGGLTTETNVGTKKSHPAQLVHETSSRALRGLAGDLGLHFLSRSRLGIKEKPTAKSEWDDFE
jgi:P27 family predicted phage terminase small subunit